MSEFKYSKLINLTKQPLIDGFRFPDYFAQKIDHTYCVIDRKYINENLISQLAELGQEFGGAVLFRQFPNDVGVIHSDRLLVNGDWVPWNAALNWNLTGAKSTMEWYEARSEPKIIESKSEEWWQDQFNSKYVLWGETFKDDNKKLDETKFIQLEQREIYDPTLVRTDIPHRVVTKDRIVRWCLSVRLKTNHTWEEICKVFESRITE